MLTVCVAQILLWVNNKMVKLDKCDFVAQFCNATVGDVAKMYSRCECIRCLGEDCTNCSIAKCARDMEYMQNLLRMRCSRCHFFKKR